MPKLYQPSNGSKGMAFSDRAIPLPRVLNGQKTLFDYTPGPAHDKELK
jgi:hypothetical protein